MTTERQTGARAPGARAPAETGGPRPDRPIPLTAIERFWLDDDRPSHPLTGIHELRVRGEVTTDELAAAVEAARRRHPLLCRVVDAAGKRPVWAPPTDDRPVAVDRAPAGVPRTHPDGPWLDVRAEIGLRVWVRDEPPAGGVPEWTLTVAIHHCCADALGGLTFLFDLFAHLAAARGGPPVPPPPDPARFAARGGLYAGRGVLPGLPKGRAGLLGHLAVGLNRLNRKPSLPLAASADATDPACEPHPGVDALAPPLGATFSREETAAVRAAAKRRGVTLNDLILRDLFLALRAHNRRAGAAETPPAGGRRGAKTGYLRVSVPVNLRQPADLPAGVGPPGPASRGPAGLSAANRIGIALVTRPPAEMDDPEALLDSLHAEMAWVRSVERGRRYLEAAALLQKVYGRMPERMLGEACFATAVLSNLGDLGRVIPAGLRDDAGRLTAPAAEPGRSLVVLSHRTAPPVRPLTRATVLASTYAGELTLHLGVDPHAVGPADARALLDDFAARVRASAAA